MARVILLFTFCCQLENDMESLLGKSSVEELQTYPDNSSLPVSGLLCIHAFGSGTHWPSGIYNPVDTKALISYLPRGSANRYVSFWRPPHCASRYSAR